MKAKVSFMMVVVILIGLMLVLPGPAQAARPVGGLQITADLEMTGPNSAAGSFIISSPLFEEDSGAAYETFILAADTIHGIKTLEGMNGTIVIKFQATSTFDGPVGRAVGSFVIISGTGAYHNLHGVGTTDATLDLSAIPPTITAFYEGAAHCDPGECVLP
jgi:hypothetical protein